MFGWYKRREQRLMARMGDMTRVAQMTTYVALENELGVADARSEEEKSSIAARAAARTNFLYGEAPADMHKNLDLAREHRFASDWLSANPLFRELVVQTLRVLSVVKFHRTQEVPRAEATVLDKYGHEFPSAPTPETYPVLLQRALATLTDTQQAEINAWAQRSMQTR
jgi:hypothetical protein